MKTHRTKIIWQHTAMFFVLFLASFICTMNAADAPKLSGIETFWGLWSLLISLAAAFSVVVGVLRFMDVKP